MGSACSHHSAASEELLQSDFQKEKRKADCAIKKKPPIAEADVEVAQAAEEHQAITVAVAELSDEVASDVVEEDPLSAVFAANKPSGFEDDDNDVEKEELILGWITTVDFSSYLVSSRVP
eukprot:CAMPEP_0172411556 /NCGR_PEP_ID=MMETSP1061-20121228/77453_1 /TAXON_ID=37318 /ORGANISM="Pseudo-nitzschia pungens, Strain cf. pungens" /LENGTH=119 /DNA_ID=CAMNT_0013147767 /DNA_START=147 /DNA_END=507 /DNA_ORIENTATION=-